MRGFIPKATRVNANLHRIRRDPKYNQESDSTVSKYLFYDLMTVDFQEPLSTASVTLHSAVEARNLGCLVLSASFRQNS